MRKSLLIFVILLSVPSLVAQNFVRSELPATFKIPWEIQYGADGFLWISEADGIIARVNPNTSEKRIVYVAPDFADASIKEISKLCFKPNFMSGTYGLAMHPDFLSAKNAFVFICYSYNSGTVDTPVTKFKIVRLKWDKIADTFIEKKDIVLNMPTGYDHVGGRLLCAKMDTGTYLFYSTGDNGVADEANPDCYADQKLNPNNYTQSINTKNGKIHRFNIDGSIPASNPVAGNSFYTRGHRNPQGLAYNYEKQIVYEIEHGNRTDDEVNVLFPGMNYGWKNVRGYHADNNYPGEKLFIDTYLKNDSIKNDSLIEPIFSWCSEPLPVSTNYLEWCTIGPSDGLYYNLNGIPNWKNSLLVVNLKEGVISDRGVYVLKLSEDGKTLNKNEPQNPSLFFAQDQELNGRLRDIAVSPDGRKLFLINNGGAPKDRIIVYSLIDEVPIVFPNPGNNLIKIQSKSRISKITVCNFTGQAMETIIGDVTELVTSQWALGLYMLKIELENEQFYNVKWVKGFN